MTYPDPTPDRSADIVADIAADVAIDIVADITMIWPPQSTRLCGGRLFPSDYP